MSITFNRITLALLSFCVVHNAYAELSAIDKKREDIVIFSRQGDAQLEQAIGQLSSLYQTTNNQKVRDDLITLMVRKGLFKEAVNICASCSLSSFSENELENLAKAYRNTQDYSNSLKFYQRLNEVNPNNPNGLLGAALVSVDLKQYADAEKYLKQYQNRFGRDNSFQDANRYLLNQTEPDASKLGRWQDELARDPKKYRSRTTALSPSNQNEC